MSRWGTLPVQAPKNSTNTGARTFTETLWVWPFSIWRLAPGTASATALAALRNSTELFSPQSTMVGTATSGFGMTILGRGIEGCTLILTQFFIALGPEGGWRL